MTTAPSGRLGYLLRWLGLTLVVLLGLQLAAVVSAWSWEEEAFRQMVIERLITQSPMALVGLLLALFGSRLDQSDARTPCAGWLPSWLHCWRLPWRCRCLWRSAATACSPPRPSRP